VNSCRAAFEELNRQTPYYPPHPSNLYSQPATQHPIPPTIPRKRQLQGSDSLTSGFPAIQPKPPGLSPAPFTPAPAESAGSYRPSPGDSAGEPAKKRRGRPSNAQIEQEKATAAAEGREWQPRPPRPPRKKKSKINKDSPVTSEAAASQPPIPQTPEIQMTEAQDESSGGRKRRRKLKEEPTMIRPAPYDPIRQSPLLTDSPARVSGTGTHVGEGPLEAMPAGQPQVAAGPNLTPEYHHSTTKTHMASDTPHHMQTEP
jgi:hypothetical protein